MSKMTITGEELYSLFIDLKAAYELLDRIVKSEGFKLSHDYEISGYTINDLREVCYTTIQLLKGIPFTPGNVD